MSTIDGPKRGSRSFAEKTERPAECVSDFVLDRLMSDDGNGDATAETARAHLASCTSCRNRLTELEAVEPPSFESLFPRSVEKRRLRGAGWIVSAVAMAAAVALWARTKQNDDPTATVRTKGDLSLDLVVRRPSGEVTRPAPGDTVFPGDALRFEVSAARSGFVTVLGLDAAGAVTVYTPSSESMIHLEGGAPTVLPGSIVADATLGPERIVAVFCAKATPLDELRQIAVRALAQAGGDPRRVTALGTPCTEAAFMIDKKDRP